MAKYKAYPEYKDSGVEWLGEIPNHWEMLRHKYVAFFTKGKNPTNLLEQPLKNALPYLSMECLRNNTTDKYALISNDVRIALEGQPLIIWDGSNAGEFVKGKPGILSSTMAAAMLTYPLYPQYYWYLCISIEPEMRKNATGMGIPHVNGEELKRISFGIPSLHEQRKIATFLDHETAKIDNLIEKQQQLIELLKEKRQAVISHAVTKGLNPDVPMKDSGVEWLGEVPEHWHKIKLKYITNQIIDAEHRTAEYFDDGEYLVCRTTNVRNGKLVLDGGMYTNLDTYNKWIKRGRPEAGDILFTREAPAGEACVYSGDIPLCLGQRMVLFKLNVARVVPEFVLHSIYSGLADDFVKQLSQGSTVSHFNMSDIQNLPLYEPPLSEQNEIKKYLACNLYKYDRLIISAQNIISLMQERRTALISAAVTGKIDVRDWVAPNACEAEVSQEVTA